MIDIIIMFLIFICFVYLYKTVVNLVSYIKDLSLRVDSLENEVDHLRNVVEF